MTYYPTSVFAIDPGIESTGYAYWEKGYELLMTVAGIIRYHGGKNDHKTWYEKAVVQVTKLREIILPLLAIKMVVCELPEFYGSTYVSGVMKLTYLVGCIGFMIKDINDGIAESRIYFVNPTSWKGQLKKNIVARRIREYYTQQSQTCHEFI